MLILRPGIGNGYTLPLECFSYLGDYFIQNTIQGMTNSYLNISQWNVINHASTEVNGGVIKLGYIWLIKSQRRRM